jgi:RNA polymerase sigma-70 factor (ECF subfamily)
VATDWDRLVREHGAAVFGTAWRILGHAADTEEVVQEVFLEAFQRWQTRPVRCWAALLRRLAACRALDRLRRRKHFSPLADNLTNGECGPEAAAMGHELGERLRQSVGELPEREAAVFCLRHFEDLSYQQIADTLGITRGAVATALHKARAKLEGMLTAVMKGD